MESSTLSREDIEDLLYHIIPKSPLPQYIDDAVFLEVKSLLGQHPDETIRNWNKDPRTYTLLRILGYEDDSTVFTTFDDQKVGDIWLPLASKFLPELLPSPESSVKQWRRVQSHVLSKPELMGLSHLESAHTHRYIIGGKAHFDEREELGRGGSAQVWRVKHKLSGKEYACKRIVRGDTIKQQREQLIQVKREIDVLQRVRHKHIVQYVGSYTDFESFALILSPVADDVLSSLLLRQCREKPLLDEDLMSLRAAFGCLANALAYAHKEKVRHKDIKPGNILISGGQIFLCDFGISFDWSEIDESTTSGQPFRFTRRYCAPEVYNKESRNTKSDIWSLGCVFLEMITVIKGYPLDEMNGYISDQCEDGPQGLFWNAAGPMKSWLDHIRNKSADDLPLDWITTLIRENPKDRPTAEELVEMIYKESRDLPQPDLFIGPCCSKGKPGSLSRMLSGESSTLPQSQTPVAGLGISDVTAEPPSEVDQTPQSPRLETPRVRRDRSISPKSQSLAYHRPGSGTVSPPSTRLSNQRFQSVSSDTTSISRHSSTTSRSRSMNLPRQSTSTVFHRISVPPPADHDIICYCSSREDETHIFNAPISSASIETPLPTIETFEKCEVGECRVQVYETLPGNSKMKFGDPSVEDVAIPQLWWVTRRLVVSYEVGTPPARHCSSFWLPLADLAFSLDDCEVSLKWSDCNQMTNKHTGNKGEYYDWLYAPHSPNNSVVLRFSNVSDAEDFVDCIRLPAQDGVTVRNRRQIHISDTQEAQIFDIGRKAAVGKILDYRAIVLTNTNHTGTQTSKLYIRWPELDLDIRIFDADTNPRSTTPFYQMSVKLDHVATPTYHSDIRGEPAVDYDRVASFKSALQLKSSFTATFPIGMKHHLPVPPEDVVTLLHSLTGWTLRYFAVVVDYGIPRRRWHSSKKYGSADIMLWEKEVEHPNGRRWGAQVTFRSHHEHDKLWTTASINRETDISTTSGAEATITIANKTRGPLLDVVHMGATKSDPGGKGHSRNKSDSHEDTSELVLTFENSEYRLEFFKLIEYFKKAAANSLGLIQRTNSTETQSPATVKRINSLASHEFSPPMRSSGTSLYRPLT